MYALIVRVKVKPEFTERYKTEIVADALGAVRDEPGCLRFGVPQSKDDPTRFVLWEWYVDEAANQAHKTTTHYLTFRAAMGDMMAEDRISELYTGIYPAQAPVDG